MFLCHILFLSLSLSLARSLARSNQYHPWVRIKKNAPAAPHPPTQGIRISEGNAWAEISHIGRGGLGRFPGLPSENETVGVLTPLWLPQLRAPPSPCFPAAW